MEGKTPAQLEEEEAQERAKRRKEPQAGSKPKAAASGTCAMNSNG